MPCMQCQEEPVTQSTPCFNFSQTLIDLRGTRERMSGGGLITQTLLVWRDWKRRSGSLLLEHGTSFCTPCKVLSRWRATRLWTEAGSCFLCRSVYSNSSLVWLEDSFWDTSIEIAMFDLRHELDALCDDADAETSIQETLLGIATVEQCLAFLCASVLLS